MAGTDAGSVRPGRGGERDEQAGRARGGASGRVVDAAAPGARGGGPAVVVLALVAALLPPALLLGVDPSGWYPFGPVKWAAATTLLLAGAAAVAGSGRRVPAPVLDRAWVVLVAALAVGAAAGPDRLYGWTGTPERHSGVLLWVLCWVALAVGRSLPVGTPGTARGLPPPIVYGAVVAGLGVGALATVEALGWEPRVLDVGDRLTGSMGSSAYLGAAAALLLPAVVGVALGPGTRPARPVAVAAGAGLGVAVVGSGARAAWAGLVGAAVVALLARRPPLRDRRRVVAVVLGSVAFGALVLLLTPAGSRLGALTDPDAPGGRGRLDEWRVATAVLGEHPVVGVGSEGYRIAFADGVDAAYQSRHGREPLPDRAHSGPLDVALAGGPVALGAWIVAWAAVGRCAWRALRVGPAPVAGAAVGLVAHWVGQLFLFPLAELEPVAWLLAGGVVAWAGRSAGAGRQGRRTGRGRLVAPLLGVAAALASVAGALDVAADRAAGRAATTGSVAEAERAARLRPDVLRNHLLLARVRVAGGEGYVAAIRAVDDALAVSPHDPVARLARARYLVQRALATEVPAHAEVARREVWTLLAGDPLDARLWVLATVLAASGS